MAGSFLLERLVKPFERCLTFSAAQHNKSVKSSVVILGALNVDIIRFYKKLASPKYFCCAVKVQYIAYIR